MIVRRHTAKYAEAGFTLLEVMVAVAIMAIAIVALLRLVVIGINNAEFDKTLTLATLMAREKLTEGLAITGEQIDAEGIGEGDFEKFSWERSTTPTVFSNISQIKVIISWEEGEEIRNVSLTQFVFNG